MGELTHIYGKNIFIFGPSVQASVMLQVGSTLSGMYRVRNVSLWAH